MDEGGVGGETDRRGSNFARGSRFRGRVLQLGLVATLLGATSSPEAASVPELPVVAAPNPFHAFTTIRFSMQHAGPATLAINDVTGRRVRTLLDGAVEPGSRSIVWDGRDDAGRAVASGVYFYRLEAAAKGHTGRLQLLK